MRSWPAHALAATVLILASNSLAASNEQTANGAFQIVDQAGDVRIDTTTLPPGDFVDGLDILAIDVLEVTYDQLVVAIQVADLHGRVWDSPAAGTAFERDFTVGFMLDGASPTRYVVSARDYQYAGSQVPATRAPMQASLCVMDGTGQCVGPQTAMAFADLDNNLVVFQIPKASLLGEFAPENVGLSVDVTALFPANLGMGDHLSAWEAGTQEATSEAWDAVAGEASETYALLTGSSTNNIGLLSPLGPHATDADRVPLAIGTATQVPFRLVNTGPESRLVSLWQEALPSGWQVRGPSVVELRPGESRDLHVRVAVPADSAHASQVELRIRAQSTGNERESVGITIPTVAVAKPIHGPNVITLLRSEPSTTTFAPIQSPENFQLTLEPAAIDQPRQPARLPWDGGALGGFWLLGAAMDFMIPGPVAIATHDTSSTTLRLETDCPGAFGFQAHGFFDGVLAATGQSLGTLSDSPTDVHIPLAVLPSPVDLDAVGHTASLTVIVERHEAATAMPTCNVLVHPGESELTVWLDVGKHQVLVDGNIFLSPIGEWRAGASPAAPAFFELAILNGDTSPHEVSVALELSAPDWTASVLPGPRFLLAAGESVRVAVRVEPDANVPEGAENVIRVVVKGDDGGGTPPVEFVATAIDAGNSDSGDAPELDPYAVARQLDVGPTENTPGVMPGLVVPAVLVVAALRRFWHPKSR